MSDCTCLECNTERDHTEMTEKRLAKIQAVRFGYGGYQNAMLGLSLTFGGQGWGVGDFRGTWAEPPSEHAKWTVEDQMRIFAETVVLLRDTLKAAKVQTVDQLKGIPVEVEFEGNVLKSWRILTEVL